MTTINKHVQYAFGFSYLGGRSVYRFAEKVVKGTFKNVHSIFPFLSQLDLLNWSKKVIDGVDGIYDKAMDAEYLRTHIGGANHRMFDGGHDLISAWKRVRDASGTDTFSQEVIGYVSAIWKDVTTPMGLPFSTWNKENYDHWAEWTKNTIPGANKKWFSDLNSFDAFEILSTSLGLAGALFFLTKKDQKKVSEILGSMGIISIITANALMGLSVIALTVFAYKKKKIDGKKALKGASYAGISLSIFTLLGLPILIELFIVINVLRLVKDEKMIGADFIYNLFSKIKSYKKSVAIANVGSWQYQSIND